MFFSMARKSNMVPVSSGEFDSSKRLTRGDIEVHDCFLLINFKWSKTRQHGHSRKIPLATISGSCFCPVTAYKNLLLQEVKSTDSDTAFSYFDQKSKLLSITYSQLQNKLRELVNLTGRNGSLFLSHGLRRAGCSFAYKSNVESELIQFHGDWLSSCYTEYLTYDFEQKLSVSRRMGYEILHM